MAASEAASLVLRDLSGSWKLDPAESSDRAELLKALGVNAFVRFLVGNPELACTIEQTRTKVSISTQSSSGTIDEAHITDGKVRDKVHSGEPAIVRAWLDEEDVLKVEVVWKKREITTIDTRELLSRVRLRHVSVLAPRLPCMIDWPVADD
jgi:hypothetical protein